MNPNNPSPPDKPRGLLFLLEPEYCDEYEFMQRLIKANEDGKLWAPEEAKVH